MSEVITIIEDKKREPYWNVKYLPEQNKYHVSVSLENGRALGSMFDAASAPTSPSTEGMAQEDWAGSLVIAERLGRQLMPDHEGLIFQ